MLHLLFRSLTTTLPRRRSRLLWWDSQWRPLSPTNTLKFPPEPRRNPACRSVCNKRLLFISPSRKHVTHVWEHRPLCFPPPPSAPPAAAGRKGGAEGNPSRTHDPEIHLRRPGAAVPAGSKRPSMWPRQWLYSVISLQNWQIESEKKKIDLLGFIKWLKMFVFFSANEKETGRRSQTFRVPVWQVERTDGRNIFFFLLRFSWLASGAEPSLQISSPALPEHPRRTPRNQPLRGEPELPEGPGGPHPGGQQQQLQRDLRLHAHPESAHDHRQQAGRLNAPNSVSVAVSWHMNLTPLLFKLKQATTVRVVVSITPIHLPYWRTLPIRAVSKTVL